MRIGSLFAGIGGFDLAAESLGWSTAWVSEIDPFACAVLAKHFPDAPNLGDVTLVDWSTVEPVDILCGGFPCQPHSLAGKRAASDDERDLWAECVRAVGVLRPRYAVFENVPGLLTSESGRFFNRVVSDVAALGYAVEWSTLSASDVGAPHKRERVWIVAYAERGRREQPDASQRPGAIVDARLAELGDASGSRRTTRLSGSDAGDEGQSGQRHDRGRRLGNWSDALPIRGADGTVRLVPAGAVAESADARLQGAKRNRAAGAEGQPDRYAGERDGRLREEAEGPRPEPSLRPLVDGLPDRLARRDRGAEEVTQWATPRAGEAKQGPSSTEKHRLSGKDWMLSDEAHDFTHGAEEAEPWPTVDIRSHHAQGADHNPLAQSTQIALMVARFGGTGGSLWPVTETEPGRVAKLRAVGNAIVPLCAVMGPFQRILELEECQ